MVRNTVPSFPITEKSTNVSTSGDLGASSSNLSSLSDIIRSNLIQWENKSLLEPSLSTERSKRTLSESDGRSVSNCTQRTTSISTLLPSLMVSITSENVIYRAEGNATLVVALIKEEKVLKLIKGNPKEDKETSFDIEVGTQNNNHSSDSILSKSIQILTNRLQLIEKIFSQLFTQRIIDLPQLIFLKKDEVIQLMEIIKKHRPAHRLHKGIPLRDVCGLIQHDHCALNHSHFTRWCTGPIISVEIKPKQGFLPDEAVLPEELKPCSQMCRFCLAQFKHLQMDEHQFRSKYCPLDLFSGCPDRMRFAVKSLIETPKNNLRVFTDKKYLYGDGRDKSSLIRFLQDNLSSPFCRGMDAFVNLIVTILTTPLGQFAAKSHQFPTISVMGPNICGIHKETSTACCRCNSSTHQIPFTSVINQILRIQKFDVLGSLQARNIFEKLLDENDESYWHSIEKRIIDLGIYDSSDSSEDGLDPDAIKAFRYLLAMTAKDCSIILSFRRLLPDTPQEMIDGNENVIFDPLSQSNVLFNLKLVDLDRKCATKAMRVYFADLQMISAFYKSIETKTQ